MLSPDKELLIITAAPWLHVIDLRTWSQVHAVSMPPHPERPSSVVPLDPQLWSPDGSTVYLRLGWHTVNRWGAAVHDDRRIWRLDIETGALSALPDLPFDSLLQPAISDDGRLLFALAFDRDDRDYFWVARGHVFLSVVDLASGEEVQRIPLPGLKIGADLEDVTHRPAAVLDDAGGRYYIVHADTEAITVINLETGVVKTTDAGAAASKPGKSLPLRLLGGLTSLFVSKAEAKGEGWLTRQAGLTPDGRLLLVTGRGYLDTETYRVSPVGLRIIDTRTLEVLHREEGVNKFVLSSAGGYVFATGFSYSAEKEWTPERGIGLMVFDLGKLEIAAHIEPGKAYGDMALTLDGGYLHLTFDGPGREQKRLEGDDSCAEPCIVLLVDVIEVDGFNLIAQYESEVFFRPLTNAGRLP